MSIFRRSLGPSFRQVDDAVFVHVCRRRGSFGSRRVWRVWRGAGRRGHGDHVTTATTTTRRETDACSRRRKKRGRRIDHSRCALDLTRQRVDLFRQLRHLCVQRFDVSLRGVVLRRQALDQLDQHAVDVASRLIVILFQKRCRASEKTRHRTNESDEHRHAELFRPSPPPRRPSFDRCFCLCLLTHDHLALHPVLRPSPASLT